GVAGAEVPGLAGHARVDDAEALADDADLAPALLLVVLVSVEELQIPRDLVEVRLVEALGRAGRDARPVGVEADGRAGPLGDAAGEEVVDDLGADDGADRLAAGLLLDRAGHDPVDAAPPHPGVVADPAVQRVGDARVAAELPVLGVLEARGR